MNVIIEIGGCALNTYILYYLALPAHSSAEVSSAMVLLILSDALNVSWHRRRLACIVHVDSILGRQVWSTMTRC